MMKITPMFLLSRRYLYLMFSIIIATFLASTMTVIVDSLSAPSLFLSLPSSISTSCGRFTEQQQQQQTIECCKKSNIIQRQIFTRSTFQTNKGLHASNNENDIESTKNQQQQQQQPLSRIISTVTSNPTQSITFSILISTCGALLGAFLDSYHSAFHVLQYDTPISLTLWGTKTLPALTTAWWVPELFALAGFIIGWLYILLDVVLDTPNDKRTPTPPVILLCISLFTLQYWLSGILYSIGYDRTTILLVLSVISGSGYTLFDATSAGFISSLATAVGGPVIEIGLLSTLTNGVDGYHYTDLGETGFFPLWIVPVYFLGGPAVGNLGRGIWSYLSTQQNPNGKLNGQDIAAKLPNDTKTIKTEPNCKVCNDTRAVGCPNCDAQGYYVTYGRRVQCNCCRGKGLVICRACFNDYGDDPTDIERIREIMSRIPD